MAYVILSPNAERQLRDEVTDPWLLGQFAAEMDRVAANPATSTIPAPAPPYRPDRLLATFQIDDATGRFWTFAVLLKRLPDEEGVYITSLRVAAPPDDEYGV